MKVITLIQPWATLIALGEKKIETRSWRTKYRGELLIHAGKKINKEICNQEPYKRVLAKHGYTVDNLPTSVIIAKCNLADCLSVKENHSWLMAVLEDESCVGPPEYIYGDYEQGRYAWKLDNVEMLREPITAKGKLGLWEKDI